MGEVGRRIESAYGFGLVCCLRRRSDVGRLGDARLAATLEEAPDLSGGARRYLPQEAAKKLDVF
jgi:hypothetical protein